jgi:hypothetical protein
MFIDTNNQVSEEDRIYRLKWQYMLECEQNTPEKLAYRRKQFEIYLENKIFEWNHKFAAPECTPRALVNHPISRSRGSDMSDCAFSLTKHADSPSTGQ